MELLMQEKCELFVQNAQTVKNAFKWDSELMSFTAGTHFYGLNMRADADKLKQCESIIKSHTGAMSEFRGSVKLPLIAKMATAEDSEKYFTDLETIYNTMNQSKWVGNTYKLLASMVLCDHAGADDMESYIDKTNSILASMKEAHRWLTSDDDLPFAAMLAVSNIEPGSLIREAERCYPILKEKFGGLNAEAVQALCHILSLNDKDAERKCRLVSDIYDGLKAQKHAYGVALELACLGIFPMYDMSADKIVEDIVEIDNYLKKQKGFGDLSIGSSMRRMFAAIIAADCYGSDNNNGAMIGNTLAISVAIEVCMCTMIMILMMQ